MAVAQMQRDMLGPLGLVGPKEGFALFSDIAKAMGFDMPDKFAMNPDSPEYQEKMKQPQQPPLPLQIEQMKQQADAQKFQAETQMDMQKFQAQSQIDERKAMTEAEMSFNLEKLKAQAKLQEVQANLELQAANDARDAERETMKAMHQQELERMKLELDKYKTDQDNETRIIVAQISAGAQQQVAAQRAEQAQMSDISRMQQSAMNTPTL
jgi:hypothetical protein